MTFAISSQQVNWWSVNTFVEEKLCTAAQSSWPLIGSVAWCELEDDHPLKMAAIYDAARHWALRLETCQRQRSEAGRDIAGAADWSVVARDVRNRADFYASRPWLKRGHLMSFYGRDNPEADWDRDGKPIDDPDVDVRHSGHLGMAVKLAERSGNRLLHVHGIGWHYWDGKRWWPTTAARHAAPCTKSLRGTGGGPKLCPPKSGRNAAARLPATKQRGPSPEY